MISRIRRWVSGVRWLAKRRQVDALEYARQWQEEEREAARQRILRAARGRLEDQP